MNRNSFYTFNKKKYDNTVNDKALTYYNLYLKKSIIVVLLKHVEVVFNSKQSLLLFLTVRILRYLNI